MIFAQSIIHLIKINLDSSLSIEIQPTNARIYLRKIQFHTVDYFQKHTIQVRIVSRIETNVSNSGVTGHKFLMCFLLFIPKWNKRVKFKKKKFIEENRIWLIEISSESVNFVICSCSKDIFNLFRFKRWTNWFFTCSFKGSNLFFTLKKFYWLFKTYTPPVKVIAFNRIFYFIMNFSSNDFLLYKIKTYFVISHIFAHNIHLTAQ